METKNTFGTGGLINILSQAVTNMGSKGGHLSLQAVPLTAPSLRKSIHQLLSKDQRIQAFEQLINITLQTPRSDYIDSVLFVGRFLLANAFLHECYIFLTVCQQRVQKVYGEPIDFTLFEQIGNMFYLTGQCQEAIKWYQKLMDMNQAPESKMYFNIGNCYQVMGKFTQAIQAYKSSTMADSKFLKSWVNLGSCYLQIGRGQKAIQAFQQLPSSSQMFTCIGNAHFRMGNLQQAIAQYLKAIEIKQEAGTYNNLGCALKKVSLYQDAIFAFNDSLSLKPSKEAANNLITLYLELGKHNEAASLLRNCTKLLSQPELRSYGRLLEEVRPSERKMTLGKHLTSNAVNMIRQTMMPKNVMGLDRKTPTLAAQRST